MQRNMLQSGGSLGGLLIKQKRRNKYTLDFLKSPHAPHTGAAAQSRSGPALCEQQQGGWRGRYGDPGGGGGGGAHPFLSAVLPNQYLGHLDKACKALCTHSYPNMPLKGTHKHTHTYTHCNACCSHTKVFSISVLSITWAWRLAGDLWPDQLLTVSSDGRWLPAFSSQTRKIFKCCKKPLN